MAACTWDKFVSSANDLKRASQIILLNDDMLHPRCHAIVTEINGDQITIIRLTYKEGVVMQTMRFPGNGVIVVDYYEQQCYEPDEVIRRAMAALNDTEFASYNLLTFNCKHFARSCKTHLRPVFQMP